MRPRSVRDQACSDAQLWENLNGFDKNQMIERGRVGYDHSHLDAKLAVGLPIMLKVPQRILQFDAMLLQKRINLYSCLVSKQLAKL